ncbi:2-hydroxychromene-2-carboxylate isomerase [Granulosicoccus sp.]|nr:2-hydroxychromene-2-carboxylate isomerase [Granulosicoccus sp.]MDB4223455.1 2-hydroxychromene-2-carboxylate isomerase [Granulosicoccus sp.]
MTKIIDFYFDFSSPYGYLASKRIEKIASAHDHVVAWHPILLGAIFKVTGQAPLTEAPLKGDYAIMDFARSAREFKLDYNHPEVFPIGAVAACRAAIWLRDGDQTSNKQSSKFIHAVFHAYYADGKDITNSSVLAELAETLGIDAAEMLSALTEKSVKDALRTEVENAIAAGVFGSPVMIVNKEIFWGNDRLEQLDRWLTSGGW